MRVLVVEDDKNLREQLASALTDAGYAIDTADNGEDGQFLGETEPYDLAILDLGLPKVDGFSVLKAWRKEGRTLPVLILSARDRWSEKVEGLDLGANDYVTKPFHMAELLARVRANVRRQTDHQSSVLDVGDLQPQFRDRAGERRRRAGKTHRLPIQGARLSDAPCRAHRFPY